MKEKVNEDEFQSLIYTDELTGLKNLRYFREQIPEYLEGARDHYGAAREFRLTEDVEIRIKKVSFSIAMDAAEKARDQGELETAFGLASIDARENATTLEQVLERS